MDGTQLGCNQVRYETLAVAFGAARSFVCAVVVMVGLSGFVPVPNSHAQILLSENHTVAPAPTTSNDDADDASPDNEASSGDDDDATEETSGEEVSSSEDENASETTDNETATSAESESVTEDVKLPEILTDLEAIPFPVKKMRELILEAARSGDVEKLRRYIGFGDDVTMLSLGGHDEDPIDFLKSLSGDEEGHEILAIITEILEAPFVKIEAAPGQEVYVWPYYYAYPFDKLTPEQRVQLFRLITYGDYEEMISFGSYIFYRLGITPDGRWRFLVAGD